jgi:hypothetical protein
MRREPRNQDELYQLWLEERWYARKLDLHYSNGKREDKRTEDILEMFKALFELSQRGVELPNAPPWEVS